jgi:hypothetical protein
MLNLQNISVKNFNGIKPIASYSAVYDSITVNLQKISKIPNHASRTSRQFFDLENQTSDSFVKTKAFVRKD